MNYDPEVRHFLYHKIFLCLPHKIRGNVEQIFSKVSTVTSVGNLEVKKNRFNIAVYFYVHPMDIQKNL